ncbi:MarR family winged helix-turn-helix transcriptional regulator [Pannonibacter phragmitetus]|uniref:MarR family winged helix-turn-helix transcriptional regulator n=1 Tax=Pannonibacter phragmitetus TaxID=121719 RepID=UPI0013C47769|nr:MarR family winged helix-turn-helix transcriptional regulator [Pannonibacter phragmitetus]
MIAARFFGAVRAEALTARQQGIEQCAVKCHYCGAVSFPKRKALILKANEIYGQPGYLLRRTHQLATSAFGQINADVDLTAVQFAALLHIRDTPGIDATRLAEAIRFDRTTIGHVIGRLEHKGLILRTEGSIDRRTKQLRITAKGSDLLAKVEPRVPDVNEIILAPLEPAQREEFLKLLGILERNASSQISQDNSSQPV